MNADRDDLPRTVLAVLFLGVLIAGAFWVLRPFVAAILWATMIVVATWPMLEWLAQRLGGRRRLAVTAFTLILLLVFIVPFFLTIGTLVTNTDRIVAWAQGLFAGGLPPAPEWLARVPLVGARAAEAWAGLAASPVAELVSRLTPYLGQVAAWFAGEIGGLGRLLVQLLLTVVLTAVFWSAGKEWGLGLLSVARRLGGDQGEHVVRLAGQAVRGVALGVVVTAILQAALGGVGLAIAGIPAAPLLAVVMFVLAIAQLGPLPVMLSAVAWLFWSEATGWGTFLLVWSVAVGTLDNFVRPVLIRKGADLPLVLIFAGVLGGLASFGLVGIFVGPVVLAVAFTLLQSWTYANEGDEAKRPAAGA